MKIVNDTEIWEPSECYFHVMHNEDPDGGLCITITPISYFKNEGHVDDSIGDHSFEDNVIPDGIGNIMESTWSSDIPREEIVKLMLDAGFVEDQEFNNFMSEFEPEE